jgi:two-component system sensor histidine kinase/response regulator
MNNKTIVNSTKPYILIVDDIPANLKILGAILEGEGFTVRPVLDGRMALQVAEKERPELILLDILMPGMDGFEVCRLLKENKNLNDVPIIFISALNDTNQIVKAFNSGGVDYITKPFHVEEVKSRVRTHLKLHQQNKELQELNASKDKFFSIIAHDLRGPLGGLMGLTEAMTDDSLEMSVVENRSMMHTMSNLSRDIFNLLENLLEWSLLQRGLTSLNPQVLSLRDVAAECILILAESARKKGIKIAMDIPIEQVVFADINMLQTVIRNLVANAVKFTPRGGKIELSAKPVNGNTVEISVLDNGIGMSKSILDSLFHLDVQTNRRGTEGESSTGLGLQLCKEFLEKCGSDIWAESEEGNGSVFYFTIPKNAVNEEDPVLSDAASEQAAEQGKNRKILIVEDDKTSELLISMAVKSIVGEVLKAKTGTEAVKLCRQHPDIDLILMDIRLPSMDGYKATRQIRQFNENVIIIAQTAFTENRAAEMAAEAGCNDYISKPINIPILTTLIQKHLNRLVMVS